MKCFNCENIIQYENLECSFCGAQINRSKTNFINYIGSKESLVGYQKSYKLVLLRCIIKNFNEKREALVSDVVSDVKNFYLDRVQRGLCADVEVDARIANIQNSTDYDVFAVMKSQPYNVINQKGFLFINRNSDGKLVFVFNDNITAFMSNAEFEKLYDILGYKLNLYYKKFDVESANIHEEQNADNSDIATHAGDNDTKTVNDSVEIMNIITLSQRAKNVLMRSGIFTIGALKAYVKTNDLQDLKNLGQKTLDEINQLLENSSLVTTSSETEIHSNSADQDMTIARAFCDNTYNLFLKFCNDKGLIMFSELSEFDFDALIYEKGFGAGRIQKIKDRYAFILENIDMLHKNSYVSIKAASVDSIKVHSSNNNLPISFLRNIGVQEKILEELKARNLQVVNDIVVALSSETAKKELIKTFGKRKFDVLVGTLKTLEAPLHTIAYSILEEIRADRSFEVYIKRSDGFTLQEIADEYGLTRERVRQIEKKFHNKIRPLMLELVFNCFKDNNTNNIRLQEVLDIFDDDSFDKIIIHTLNFSDELEYLDFAEMYIPKRSKEQNTFEELYAFAKNFIGDGINLYDKLDELDELLAEKGYNYIDADSFLNLLIACNAKFYGDYVVFDRQSYGYLCAKVVGKYFKNGINLYSDDDLNLLREYARKEFGGLKLPEKNRALAARVDSYLIMVDKGKSNTVDTISVEFDILEEVKEYIDSNNRSELYYTEIFSEYEGLLCMTTGITNPYCLHGVLSYYYPDSYEYGRDFLTKKGEEYISISLEERVNEILISVGHSLSRNEIKNRLPGCSDVMILNAVYKSKKLMQWDSNYYNSIDNIKFLNNEIEDLEMLLDVFIDENSGYCSDRLIYNEVFEVMPEFCERNKIINHTNLFYVLATLFNEKYKFSQPHICIHGLVDDISTKNIAMHFLEGDDEITYTEFSAVADKFMWSHVTTGLIFSELEKEYFRISHDRYIKKELIGFSNQTLEFIQTTISMKLNAIGYLSLIGLDDFSEFCDIEYEWNPFLLASIVENYDIGYKIIQPQSRDRRYQKGFILQKESMINTYDELVVKTMKYHNVHTIRESQLLSFLIINHLTTKAIPKELQVSDIIMYENETYSI